MFVIVATIISIATGAVTHRTAPFEFNSMQQCQENLRAYTGFAAKHEAAPELKGYRVVALDCRQGV